MSCLRSEPDLSVMHDQLANFFQTPNKSRYLAVRATLIRHYAVADLSSHMLEVADLIAAQQFAAARKRIVQLLPQAALSPRLHFLAALAAEKLHDQFDWGLECFMFQACLDGLLATGDGTESQPYLVTYLTDEQDILEARDLQSVGQSVVEKNAKRFDVLTCTNDQKIWFDISHLLVATPQRIVARNQPLTTRPTRKDRVRKTKVRAGN